MQEYIPFNKPYLSGNELTYIRQAFDNWNLNGDGPFTRKCQQWLEEKIGCHKALLTNSCTAALEMSAILLDLKAGDEVIMPSYSFVSTANAFVLRGAVPVFVDIRADTLNIDESKIEAAITDKTKAICVVHYAGVGCEMDSIMAIAKQHNLFVIEDAAQSIGASFHFKDGTAAQSGTIGDFGCTSFFPSKNLGCYGDGGALFTNDDALAETARMVVNHGMKIRYYHDEIGVNSRLDSIQAAVLSVKLKRLNDYCNARRMAAYHYDQTLGHLPGFSTPLRMQNSCHVFHQYTLKIEGVDRSALQAHLMEKGIPAMIYYPVPLHQQKAYQDDRYPTGHFPIAEKLAAQVLSLPMHTELDAEQLEYITNTIIEYISNNA